MLDLLDTYSGGWNVLLLALLECIAVAYTYGVFRFIKDIEVMISNTTCFPAWYCYKYWWILCWCFFTPLAVTVSTLNVTSVTYSYLQLLTLTYSYLLLLTLTYSYLLLLTVA